MLASTPPRLAGRIVPALLIVFYGCSDPSAPAGPRVEPRVHALEAPVVTVLNTDDSGAGSLRQAVFDAADGSVIRFDPSIAGKRIVLTTGLVLVDKYLTIEGPMPAGITISGGVRSAIFGVLNSGELTLRNLSVVDGFSGSGGGIVVDGRLMLDHTLIANNQASDGGGIATINDNAIVTIINSTISGNVASGGGGGFFGKANLTIRNSTIANNTAQSGGGVELMAGLLSVRNSIIADNLTSAAIPINVNCSIVAGVNVSLSGTNLSNDVSCGTAPSFILAIPALKPLADNGGPTRTHAIDFTSRALDGGTLCTEASDQRYVPRNQGTSCDIGAFEFNDFGTFAFKIGPNVTVDRKTGVATVTGTVACSKLGSALVQVSLRQTQKTTGKVTTIIEGGGAVNVASCDASPSSWSTTVTPTSGQFENGAASASVTTVNWPLGFLQGAASATVKVFTTK